MSEPDASTALPRLDAAAASRLLSALDDLDAAPLGANDHPHHPTPAAPKGYIIDRAVGAGGGGSVFRAFRDGSDRPVALKILDYRLGLSGEDRTADRARRELQLLQDLHLPALPRVIDHGVDPATGRLYIATEFIEGRTLDEHCPAATLDLRARVDLLARVADAVQSLHSHGVIHRDLKPSNILIDSRGEPILIDLGIASMLSEFGAGPASTLTEEGRPIGTPAFMAPEQARGERALISTRSDVYGLGATGFMILTGATPHDTSTTIHEAIRRVAMDEPRDPRSLEPTLPRALGAVLAKACARDPQRRYASAGAFADDLRRWLGGEPVEAQPPGPWLKAVRWAERHPVIVTAAACVLIVALTIPSVMLSVWWLDQQPWRVEKVGAQEVRLVARSGEVLHSWRSGVANGDPSYIIRLAELVDRPVHLGGGRVVVLLMPREPDHAELGHQLVVYGLDDPERPLWRAPSELVPPRPRQPSDESYVTSDAVLADVFPELPGQEIVTCHNQAYSPSALRVWDLDGNILYEAWHTGSLTELYWMEDARLLVLHGIDNTRSWKDAGAPGVLNQNPTIYFGIRLSQGARLGVINGPHPDTAAQVAWYRYRLPPESSDLLSTKFKLPNNPARRGSLVIVNHELLPAALVGAPPGSGGGFWWELDAEGQVVFAGVSDNLGHARPDLDFTSFRLGDFPSEPTAPATR